jgi:hypothetical protein
MSDRRRPETRKPLLQQGFPRWARLVSNQRPLACEAVRARWAAARKGAGNPFLPGISGGLLSGRGFGWIGWDRAGFGTRLGRAAAARAGPGVGSVGGAAGFGALLRLPGGRVGGMVSSGASQRRGAEIVSRVSLGRSIAIARAAAGLWAAAAVAVVVALAGAGPAWAAASVYVAGNHLVMPGPLTGLPSVLMLDLGAGGVLSPKAPVAVALPHDASPRGIAVSPGASYGLRAPFDSEEAASEHIRQLQLDLPQQENS